MALLSIAAHEYTDVCFFVLNQRFTRHLQSSRHAPRKGKPLSANGLKPCIIQPNSTIVLFI